MIEKEQCRPLGKTGMLVSPIAFGALTLGPVHKNLPLKEGAKVIRCGLEQGINLIDTAECYDTYDYIREALVGWDQEVFIATKSYAWNRPLMEKAFEDARRSLNRETLDIFLLHEQESGLTIKGHWEAMEFLLTQKAKGNLKAVGISTHAVAGVKDAAMVPEIDVIHPIINRYGHGIIDGSRDEMLSAIKNAADAGKGLYGMKALAGGKLAEEAHDCFSWAFGVAELSSFAVGMKSEDEVHINVAWALGQHPDETVLSRYQVEKRHIAVAECCRGCEACIKRCGQGAISMDREKNRAKINLKKCVLCGYCRDNCEEHAIMIN